MLVLSNFVSLLSPVAIPFSHVTILTIAIHTAYIYIFVYRAHENKNTQMCCDILFQSFPRTRMTEKNVLKHSSRRCGAGVGTTSSQHVSTLSLSHATPTSPAMSFPAPKSNYALKLLPPFGYNKKEQECYNAQTNIHNTHIHIDRKQTLAINIHQQSISKMRCE